MEVAFDQVIASYHRARSSGQLFDGFYEIFLAKSPEIRQLFVKTDFKRQKLMLKQSLLELLVFYQTRTGADDIRKLGKRHVDLKIKPEHYDLCVDALCEALQQRDPEFTPELDKLWRDALRPGIDLMLEGQ